MALIKCPERNNQVSSTAVSCPQCGAPIADSPDNITQLTTIQLTAKRLKVQIVFSSLAFWVGIIWFFFGFAGEGENSSLSPVAAILIVISIIWFIVTKIRIWWHHK